MTVFSVGDRVKHAWGWEATVEGFTPDGSVIVDNFDRKQPQVKHLGWMVHRLTLVEPADTSDPTAAFFT